MNWFFDILFGVDDDCKDNEDDGGVQMIKFIYLIVVILVFELGVCGEVFQDIIKQYVGELIYCWCLVEFMELMVDYMNNVCWI